MPFNPKAIPPAQLGTAATVAYISDGHCKATKILMVTVSNTTATNRIFNSYLVPAGGTAGPANQVSPGVAIPANSVYTAWELVGHFLMPGASLQCTSDAAAALTINGALVEQA